MHTCSVLLLSVSALLPQYVINISLPYAVPEQQLHGAVCSRKCYSLATLRVILKPPYLVLPQAGWLILESFPEHVDVLAFMNAIDNLYGESSICRHAWHSIWLSYALW